MTQKKAIRITDYLATYYLKKKEYGVYFLSFRIPILNIAVGFMRCKK